MQTREIGQSGIEASVIGLGTWAMGGWMWGGTDEKASIDAIHASLDNGVSLIDTAPAYGLGVSEELVGKAIKGRRDQVVLATKCGLVWHTNKGNHFFDENGKPVHRYLGADAIQHEVEQSLKRLQTDYLDLYITHWQDPTTPVEETMDALLALKKAGKIRAIGISNANQFDLDQYQRSGVVDAVQEKYNLIERQLEKTLLPSTIKSNVSCLSYSSLAMGLLSGKVTPERIFTGDDQRITDPMFTVENRRWVQKFCQSIEPIARQKNISVAQLVIAATLQQPGITYALCGARNAVQAIENAAAGGVVLSQEEIKFIDAKSHEFFGELELA
ncbi:aldo/keto reductase [Vibrio methylphosphonaticus]|uniref:aldo/keto reductase n=1 Tax=Vibrio methylphosphonaticus TaxID=2946866 RepID=UPI00202A410C|nr:aldo/keto reductase [Vibrio methylphosphonaticus]MCL9775927.1 aldo/keto reductase [Vibrio methylphosphonaticus]